MGTVMGRWGMNPAEDELAQRAVDLHLLAVQEGPQLLDVAFDKGPG